MSNNEFYDILVSDGHISENMIKERFGEFYAELEKIDFPENFKFRQKLYHYVNKDFGLELGLCRCGSRCRFRNFRKGYNEYCSLKCAQNSDKVKNKKIRTCEERYGEKYITKTNIFKEKSRNTKKEKYGDEYYTNREKCWDTCSKIYGIENPFQLESSKQKAKQTNLEKRGVEYAAQSDEFKKKAKETMITKYGCEYALQSPDFKEKLEKTNIAKYGVPYACMRKDAKMKGNNSKPNLDFANLLAENNIMFEREFSLLTYSYDFKIGDCLIEINPTITHNSHISSFGRNPTDPLYHFNKSNVAAENGFTCIHIWDWTDKNHIIGILKNGHIKSVKTGKLAIHWYHIKKKKHITVADRTYDEMIAEGFLPVYDDGRTLIIN